MVITARLNTFSSGAGSSSGGIRVAESIESGAQLHLGRMPTGSYSGYYWTSIAGGGGGGVPSGIASGNWIRIIRRGNSVTGYRAADVSGAPGTWIQIGQAQTIIMTTPIYVGFYVNNASGVGLNTCTFSNLSIVPLNKAPIVGVTSITSPVVSSTPISGTVTDDGYPTPTVTKQWSVISSPGISILNPLSLNTTTTITGDGLHKLRLIADDSSVQSFANLSFTGYVSSFSQWQSNTFTSSSDPVAAPDADPDHDGLPNLLEYALNTSGSAASASPIVNGFVTSGSDRYLCLTVPKNPAATDVTFIVEATSDVMDPQGWSSTGLVVEQNTSTLLRVRDNVAVGSSNRRFMRVRIAQP
jgi:hypothetical protein